MWLLKVIVRLLFADADADTSKGYYLVYRHQLPSMSTLFAQLWKEYTLSDSRYLTHDIFTVSVETITCVSSLALALVLVLLLLLRLTQPALYSSPGVPSLCSRYLASSETGTAAM